MKGGRYIMRDGKPVLESRTKQGVRKTPHPKDEQQQPEVKANAVKEKSNRG